MSNCTHGCKVILHGEKNVGSTRYLACTWYAGTFVVGTHQAFHNNALAEIRAPPPCTELGDIATVFYELFAFLIG